MITSEANVQIKQLVRLQKSAKERRKKRCFIAEGLKLAEEACLAGRLQKIYLSEKMYEEEKERLAALFPSVDEELVSERVFSGISDTVTPQGILGVVSMPEYSFEEIVQGKEKRFLVLDDLRDPGNLGTIMRTAEGAGMQGIFLSKGSVDLFNPKVVRATMGSIFRMPFFYAESLPELIRRLREEGIAVYGCTMEGEMRYDQVDYRAGAALVIGNEANGISGEVRRELTAAVRIPMAGKLESLNAAVAAAILMYESAKSATAQNPWH